MKKIILLFSALMLTIGIQAQLQTPQPSPSQKIEQKAGLTDITLEYSRPSMRGRTIFGDLVPYNKVWRTGANMNTKISFSDDVEIGGKPVKAGTYAIFTKPGKSNWEIYLYKDATNWGEPEKWDDSKVVAKVTAPVYPFPMDVETFTMSFDDVENNAVNLGILWEKTYVALPIKLNTDKAVMASIDKVMNGPQAGDYYSAAVYYMNSDKDINQAKKWIDKAMEMTKEPAYYQYRQKALIYAKAGDKKGAIEAVKKSTELAKKAGSDDYVALNKKSLEEWGAN